MSSRILLQSARRDMCRHLEPRKHVDSRNETFFKSI